MANCPECCGNCTHHKNEDAYGWGWCESEKDIAHCSEICTRYQTEGGEHATTNLE